MSEYRKTSQPLLPKIHKPSPPGQYDMYPVYSLSAGKIEHGFLQLASHLSGHSQIVIDGSVGVLWEHFRDQLDQALRHHGVQPGWVSAAKTLRPADEIETLVEPFLGGGDPIFGKRFSGMLADFFELGSLPPDRGCLSGLRRCSQE